MMYISVLNVVCTFSVINERERERQRERKKGVIHTLVLNNKTGYSLLSINNWPINAIANCFLAFEKHPLITTITQTDLECTHLHD